MAQVYIDFLNEGPDETVFVEFLHQGIFQRFRAYSDGNYRVSPTRDIVQITGIPLLGSCNHIDYSENVINLKNMMDHIRIKSNNHTKIKLLKIKTESYIPQF